jgi:hypothetical protein
MEKKTFKELREDTEPEQLDEFRVLRAGAALFYATKVKEKGKRIETVLRRAQSDFNKVKNEKEIDKKLTYLSEGMGGIVEALWHTRFMLGEMTGVSLSSALIAERSNKELEKMIKGRKR